MKTADLDYILPEEQIAQTPATPRESAKLFAVNRAKKTMINVPMKNETIPHEVYNKMGAAKIMIKPAKKGRGVISGGVTRVILELAGVKNITTKTLGSNNKINNARCTIEALRSLRPAEKKAKVEKTTEKTEK